MSASSVVSINLDNEHLDRPPHQNFRAGADLKDPSVSAQNIVSSDEQLPCGVIEKMSPWSCSGLKRVFDCSCVLLALPLVLPIFLLTALAVRVTSSGPVLFLQQRMGRGGKTFTIFKFRSLIHSIDVEHHPVTTAANQKFTPVGLFIRRWKLDELPQLFNVLLGDMSLVGPWAKIPEHLKANLPCRPGITGAATITFAREEAVLAHVPREHLNAYFHSVILPVKCELDACYMATATFRSDLKLIVDSAFRRWDRSALENLLKSRAFAIYPSTKQSGVSAPAVLVSEPIFNSAPMPPRIDRTVPAEQFSAF